MKIDAIVWSGMKKAGIFRTPTLSFFLLMCTASWVLEFTRLYSLQKTFHCSSQNDVHTAPHISSWKLVYKNGCVSKHEADIFQIPIPHVFISFLWFHEVFSIRISLVFIAFIFSSSVVFFSLFILVVYAVHSTGKNIYNTLSGIVGLQTDSVDAILNWCGWICRELSHYAY